MSHAASRHRLPIAAAIGALVGIGILSFALVSERSAAELSSTVEGDSAELVARGEYLATVGSCNDCHTPWVMDEEGPAPDLSRMLSGHPESLVMPEPPSMGDTPWLWAGAGSNTAFAGPWGVSYAINLTPDANTGIGIWTEEIFVQTLRTGRHWGVARPILPPMPWPNYARMTDEDLRAVYAYLRSIPPVHNRVPDSQPATGGGPAG
jgi:mono/diheme cytochrome c family protein